MIKKIKLITFFFIALMGLIVFAYQADTVTKDEIYVKANEKLLKFLEMYNEENDEEAIEEIFMNIPSKMDVLPSNPISYRLDNNSIEKYETDESGLILNFVADVIFKTSHGVERYKFIIFFHNPSFSKKIHRKHVENKFYWGVGWRK